MRRLFRASSRALAGAILAAVLATPGLAQPVAPGSVVGVAPLTYSYRVTQEYRSTVAQTDSYLKGHFRENSSASARESYQARDTAGMVSASASGSASASSRSNASGNYDLKGGSRTQVESFNDKTIVEKKLDSGAFTGVLESALSEADLRVADRSQLAKVQGERKHMKESDFGASKAEKGSKLKVADYLLDGQIESMRLENPRNVPDGTNQRYAVGGVVKISIKLTSTKSGVADFARTFTGKARKTFNAADPVPADEVMELAMDDLANQVAAALTGTRVRTGVGGDDSEYEDSPGKRLRP